jgi:anthranilate synthase/aminodeoxychorismate synthase-like glutamine amidotransferase
VQGRASERLRFDLIPAGQSTMNIALIDNYDSFTYNLHDLIYRVSGEQPRVFRNDALSFEAFVSEPVDCVVLSPGPGHPARQRDFGICSPIVAHAALPILGICLGHQGIAHEFGGTVTRAPWPVHGLVDYINHDGTGMFEGIPPRAEMVRYHSLIVEDNLPTSLRKTAWTDNGLVMGIQHIELPIAGVQFHPESICSKHGDTLISNFLQLVKAWNSVVRQDV